MAAKSHIISKSVLIASLTGGQFPASVTDALPNLASLAIIVLHYFRRFVLQILPFVENFQIPHARSKAWEGLS